MLPLCAASPDAENPIQCLSTLNPTWFFQGSASSFRELLSAGSTKGRLLRSMDCRTRSRPAPRQAFERPPPASRLETEERTWGSWQNVDKSGKRWFSEQHFPPLSGIIGYGADVMIADCVMASNLRKSITLLDVTTNLQDTPNNYSSSHSVHDCAIQHQAVFNDVSITLYAQNIRYLMRTWTQTLNTCTRVQNGFVFD